VEAAIKRRTVSINEINQWPEVRLEPVEEKKIKSLKEYSIDLVMEPYSVTLIVLFE
jgi:hypothetical protein